MSRTGRALRRFLVRVYLHGLLLIFLAGASVFLVLESMVRPAMDQRVDGTTAWVVDHMALSTGDPARLERELAALKGRANIQLSFYDARGALLATGVHPPLPPLPAEQAARLEPGVATPIGPPHTHAVGLFTDGRRVGHAIAHRAIPASPITPAVVALLAVLLVLAAASIPLARSVARPIERLRGVAQAFGAGQLEVRSAIARQDEIGDLARSFDEMADRLVALRRAEKELLANVSHELRTPLSRIRVVLDLASEGDPQRVRRYLGELAEDLGELERLVNDVLTAARLDLAVNPGGLPRLERAPADLGDLVEGAATRFRARSPERQLALAVDLDGPVSFTADRSLLRRAIDNLLDNAQKYSDADAPVTLRARLDGGAAVIEVEDRGVGIPEEDLPHLFRPFFRGDQSRTRATGGVGLGLMLARRIVEAHGGRLEIESRVGEGTTARIALPVEAGEAA
ncbi:HAMP domain-containing sensor histidine kinase [Sorangium sp. So ce296]|uniref:sensor histidine kinase n=1 Tax=Sorangium sp. So ce296 TaxID=3133296 RepID=UPI003F633AB1